jgi:ankyrin repeat protein
MAKFDEMICSICKKKNSKVPVNFETRCKHKFHKNCLRRHLISKIKTCPKCSTRISLSAIVEKRIREENYENMDSLSYEDLNEVLAFFVRENNTDHFMEMIPKFESISSISKYNRENGFKFKFDLEFEFRSFPIFEACKNGNLEILEKLFQLDICDKYEKDGQTLYYASERGHTDIVEMLIHLGMKVNYNVNIYGKSPLHYACQNGH